MDHLPSGFRGYTSIQNMPETLTLKVVTIIGGWSSTSTVGTYNEQISIIRVREVNGDMGYYIPYIHVTNDAAMATGRFANIQDEASRDLCIRTINSSVDLLCGCLLRRLFLLSSAP